MGVLGGFGGFGGFWGVLGWRVGGVEGFRDSGVEVFGAPQALDLKPPAILRSLRTGLPCPGLGLRGGPPEGRFRGRD